MCTLCAPLSGGQWGSYAPVTVSTKRGNVTLPLGEDRFGSRYWFKEPSPSITSRDAADAPYDPEQGAATRLAAGAAKRPTPPRVSPSSAQLPHNRLAAAARSSGPGECSRGPAFSAMQEIERDKLEMAISSSTVRVKKRLLMGRVRATGAEREHDPSIISS